MDEILKTRKHLLDMIGVAFIVTDMHSKILYTNRYAERLFGYERGELEDNRIRILFLEEDLTYFLPNIIFLTIYKNGFTGEVLLRQKEGQKVFTHLSTASFKEKGEVFLAFSFQEIQRLKDVEKEKREMEHWVNLGMMVEEIAHQIRNPIVSISGFAKRLIKTLSLPQKGKSYLEKIIWETKRLENMIQQMEEYILIPKPHLQMEKVQVVVEEVFRAISKEAQKKGISLQLENEEMEEHCFFFIDKGLIVKTLSNILQNSMDAIVKIPKNLSTLGGKEKVVKVRLFKTGENIGISISDKGEGISKKNIDRIFEPFFSTRPERVGLGLTFAKKVVEEHGGRIHVESRPKRGTTVILSLPKDRRRQIRRELIASEVENTYSFA